MGGLPATLALVMGSFEAFISPWVTLNYLSAARGCVGYGAGKWKLSGYVDYDVLMQKFLVGMMVSFQGILFLLVSFLEVCLFVRTYCLALQLFFTHAK